MNERAPGPVWRRVLWFIGLWAAGVACVALVGVILRVWLR